jgi:hypothetical protein
MERPTIYVGSEANVWHGVLTWAGGATFDTVEGYDAAALEAALGATLFAETRTIHVSGAGVVDAAWWGRVRGNIRACGSIVSQEGTHTKQSKVLEAHANVILCDRRWVTQMISEAFKVRGVLLEPGARQIIETGCEGDLSRVRSVATICNMAGITKLGAAGATQLLGSSRSVAKIWEACDHLLDGRLHEAVERAAQSEDVPLAANLTETLRSLLVLREGGTVAGMHPYIQKRRRAWAWRHDKSAITNALRVATRCEHMIRNSEITGSAAVVRVHMALGQATQRQTPQSAAAR